MLAPGGGAESWTVIGPDLRLVEPVERYLAWLSRIERAPTTVRAYAHDLKTFWEFVDARGIEWDRVSLEQLGEFTAWLRQPADGGQRLVEMNEPVRLNLIRIIDGLETLEDDDGC